MSTRTQEFREAARERVDLASGFLAAVSPSGAMSTAYFGMLYAARAALSEENRDAETESGTWLLFQKTFVDTGRFDRDLFEQVKKTVPLRIRVDIDARPVERQESEAVVDLAGRFVRAVEDLYPD